MVAPGDAFGGLTRTLARALVGVLALALLQVSIGAALAAEERIPIFAEGGVYTVPVMINGAFTIDFVLDTGAAVVLVPADVALTLMRIGTIDRFDIRGADEYALADGSLVENTKINFRSLQIGSITLRNVEGVIGGVESTLLLGQSALRRLEPWRLDTRSGHLVVMEAGTGAADDSALDEAPAVADRPQAATVIAPTTPAIGGLREVRLHGWTADRNAAIVGRSGVDSRDALGVNFPLDGQGARLVVCSSDPALRGAPQIKLAINVDGEWLGGGTADAASRNENCWNIYLPSSVLSAIKHGSRLWVAVADRILYQADLTGSAKAMNRAWGYVEQRLPAAR